MWSAYDQMADGYPQHAGDSPYNAHDDRPAVLEALGPVLGRRVLDAGCGPGLRVVALLAAGADVIGLDASPVMVDLARRRVGTHAQIDLGELGAALPYADQSFDLAVCSDGSRREGPASRVRGAAPGAAARRRPGGLHRPSEL